MNGETEMSERSENVYNAESFGSTEDEAAGREENFMRRGEKLWELLDEFYQSRVPGA